MIQLFLYPLTFCANQLILSHTFFMNQLFPPLSFSFFANQLILPPSLPSLDTPFTSPSLRMSHAVVRHPRCHFRCLMKSHLQRLITIVEIPLFLITKLCNSEQLHFRHLVSHAGRAKAGGLFIKYFGGGHKFLFCGTLLFTCFLSDLLMR